MSDPALIRDAVIEAAARALRKEPILFDYPPDECWEIVRVVLAAVAPLIRAAALEEAARIFDEDSRHLFDGQGIAAAIRSLKEQP